MRKYGYLRSLTWACYVRLVYYLEFDTRFLVSGLRSNWLIFGAKANKIIEEIMFSCKVDFFRTLPFTWNLICPRKCFVRANWPMIQNGGNFDLETTIEGFVWASTAKRGKTREELGLQEITSFSTPRRSLVHLQKAVFFGHKWGLFTQIVLGCGGVKNSMIG